jgi:DNA-binding transcriptional MerR regulator
LAFIKRAKALGLNLSEIQEILAVHDAGDLPCGVAKERLIHKLQAITEQIQSLEILKSELQGILCGWQEKPSPEQISRTICPNIQS